MELNQNCQYFKIVLVSSTQYFPFPLCHTNSKFIIEEFGLRKHHNLHTNMVTRFPRDSSIPTKQRRKCLQIIRRLEEKKNKELV